GPELLQPIMMVKSVFSSLLVLVLTTTSSEVKAFPSTVYDFRNIYTDQPQSNTYYQEQIRPILGNYYQDPSSQSAIISGSRAYQQAVPNIIRPAPVNQNPGQQTVLNTFRQAPVNQNPGQQAVPSTFHQASVNQNPGQQEVLSIIRQAPVNQNSGQQAVLSTSPQALVNQNPGQQAFPNTFRQSPVNQNPGQQEVLNTLRQAPVNQNRSQQPFQNTFRQAPRNPNPGLRSNINEQEELRSDHEQPKGKNDTNQEELKPREKNDTHQEDPKPKGNNDVIQEELKPRPETKMDSNDQVQSSQTAELHTNTTNQQASLNTFNQAPINQDSEVGSSMGVPPLGSFGSVQTFNQ
ncbi:unnamed protein product, partial [Meganyctiphanes norvegica]